MAPLVLLPGMNCSADLWSGCGLEGDTVALDEQTMTAQVGRLLQQLPERFVLVGLSLGGIVAMALTVRAPGRVAGLCVMSTNAKAPTSAQRAGWREWEQRLQAGASARSLQASILDRLVTAPAQSRLAARVLAMGDAVGSAQLTAQLRLQVTRSDLRPALARLRVPTLVISGTRDALCPPAFHTEIVEAIADAQLVSVDAGHLLPMEHPEIAGEVIRAWRSDLK